MSRTTRLFLYLELTICFGPTIIFLVVGFVLLPHQIFLLYSVIRKDDLVEEVMRDSLPVIGYFLGAYLAAFSVIKMVRIVLSGLTNREINPVHNILLLIGIAAIIFGPYGIMNPHEIKVFSVAPIMFSILPLVGIIHLWCLSNRPRSGQV